MKSARKDIAVAYEWTYNRKDLKEGKQVAVAYFMSISLYFFFCFFIVRSLSFWRKYTHIFMAVNIKIVLDGLFKQTIIGISIK